MDSDLEKNGVNIRSKKERRMTARWGFLVCDGMMSEGGGRRERERQTECGMERTGFTSALCERVFLFLGLL